jgi:hypothetical protein
MWVSDEWVLRRLEEDAGADRKVTVEEGEQG